MALPFSPDLSSKSWTLIHSSLFHHQHQEGKDTAISVTTQGLCEVGMTPALFSPLSWLWAPPASRFLGLLQTVSFFCPSHRYPVWPPTADQRKISPPSPDWVTMGLQHHIPKRQAHWLSCHPLHDSARAVSPAISPCCPLSKTQPQSFLLNKAF